MKRLILIPVLLLCGMTGICTGETPESTKKEIKMNSNAVNVLTLGVKNDGSEDVSGIVNQATEKSALFFPAGIYRVEKPLYLKNPVIGEGYCRSASVSPVRTWFVSAIDSKDSSVGVLNFSEGPVNAENFSIRCYSHECGIRIAPCSQKTMAYVEKVGIYNVRGYGVYIEGSGSRPVFLHTMTIFSSSDFPVPGVGIMCKGPADNRFSDIEVMGCRIGLYLDGGFHYGDNLHLWTGSMCGHDNGCWWRGTRGIVLDNGSVLNASQVYPDTSFYALEQRADNCTFHIKNIFYWEDASTGNSKDYDGAFLHGNGLADIDGGEIAVMNVSDLNGRMKQVAMHNQHIRNVVIRTNLPVTAENLEKLSAGDELPDYTMTYTEQGYCHAGDVVVAAEKGYTEAEISTDDGAVWKLRVIRTCGEEPQIFVEPLTPLCTGRELKYGKMKDGVIAFYYLNSGTPVTLRFATRYMSSGIRPVHYGLLRTLWNTPRGREVLKTL